MQGRRPPSLFLTKKNPAEAGDLDGTMKPLANSSSIYFLMVSDSGCERGKTLPLGGAEPGMRSMAQSLGRWGGSLDALALLKASDRSWYSAGSSEESQGLSSLSCGWMEGWLDIRQWRWQDFDHWRISCVDQDMRGLCLSSQGKPRMTGFWGDSMANSLMNSVWRAPVWSCISGVMNLILPEPSGLPSSAATATRDSHGMRGILWDLAKETSIKFPAAPESIIAMVSILLPPVRSATGTPNELLWEDSALTAGESRRGGRVGQVALRWPAWPL